MNNNLISPSASATNFFQPPAQRMRHMAKKHPHSAFSFADALAEFMPLAPDLPSPAFDADDHVDLSTVAQFYIDEVVVADSATVGVATPVKNPFAVKGHYP